MQRVLLAYEAIPLLALEWQQNIYATAEKFRQFISYHEQRRNVAAACLYRCAFVQLARQQPVTALHGCGLTEEQLKAEVGV